MENQEGILAAAGGNGFYRGALGVFVGLGTPFSFPALFWYCKVWNVLLGWRILFLKTFAQAICGLGRTPGQHNSQVSLTPGGAGYLSVMSAVQLASKSEKVVLMALEKTDYVQ